MMDDKLRTFVEAMPAEYPPRENCLAEAEVLAAALRAYIDDGDFAAGRTLAMNRQTKIQILDLVAATCDLLSELYAKAESSRGTDSMATLAALFHALVNVLAVNDGEYGTLAVALFSLANRGVEELAAAEPLITRQEFLPALWSLIVYIQTQGNTVHAY